MTCNCIDTVLAEAKKEALRVAPEHDPETFNADWDNKFFMVGGNGKPSRHGIGLPVKIEYRRLKTNRQPYQSMTIKRLQVFMSFCPFCGAELDDGGIQDAG